ncbi:hypothetical protein RFI_13257, partial [Reticulomyxa filosa]
MEEEKGLHQNDNTFFDECNDKAWITLLITEQNEIDKTHVCLLCQRVVKNAMELVCNEHDTNSKSLIIGEGCLKRYLQKSGGKCPIGQHSNCKFLESARIRKHINNMVVVCPRQFELDMDRQSNEIHKTEAKEKKSVCTFQGRVEAVDEHLKNSCPIQAKDCWFEKFGCSQHANEQDTKSQTQTHLKLVLEYVQWLEQKLKHANNFIQALQSQNVTQSCQVLSVAIFDFFELLSQSKGYQRLLQNLTTEVRTKDEHIQQLNDEIEELKMSLQSYRTKQKHEK